MRTLTFGYIAIGALSAALLGPVGPVAAGTRLAPEHRPANGAIVRPAGGRETVLYSFSGGLDGAQPQAGLLADASGALYGTAEVGGGSSDDGTVYKLTPSKSGYAETILHTFVGGNDDGAYPFGALVADTTGALYGSTLYGGPADNGTIYKLTPSGTTYVVSFLYGFNGGNDGANPLGALILDKHGALYGTTQNGGASGFGIVFKLTRSGSAYKRHILHVFRGGKDGATPRAKLLPSQSGALYGTTLNGGGAGCDFSGQAGCGIVYELLPSGRKYKEIVLYRFQGGKDGANPYGDLIADSNGVLYSTTGRGGGTGCGGTGCGTVFKLTPNPSGTYTESVLYRFKGGNDGLGPTAGLVAGANGALYGTTILGGTANNGTVYVMTPSGPGFKHSVLHRFEGSPSDGSTSGADLIFGADGALYSTTQGGGNSGSGTVFRMTP
jgi:uncharacterized repeat protein (TIGR03803 family)